MDRRADPRRARLSAQCARRLAASRACTSSACSGSTRRPRRRSSGRRSTAPTSTRCAATRRSGRAPASLSPSKQVTADIAHEEALRRADRFVFDAAWLGHVPPPERPLLLFDGGCPFCRAAARLVARLDRSDRLALLSRDDVAAAPYAERIPEHQVAESWQLIEPSGVRLMHGPAATRLLEYLPATAWLACVIRSCRLAPVATAANRLLDRIRKPRPGSSRTHSFRGGGRNRGRRYGHLLSAVRRPERLRLPPRTPAHTLGVSTYPTPLAAVRAMGPCRGCGRPREGGIADMAHLTPRDGPLIMSAAQDAEASKQLVRRLVDEVVNQRNADALDGLALGDFAELADVGSVLFEARFPTSRWRSSSSSPKTTWLSASSRARARTLVSGWASLLPTVASRASTRSTYSA